MAWLIQEAADAARVRGHDDVVTEKSAPRRTLLGYLTWAATGLVAAVTLAHALRSGRGWGGAAAGAIMFVLYSFLPRIQAASDRRRKAQDGSVTVDDWGVTRVVGDDLRESIAWDDVAWVRIYTTSAGPGAEDVFFALGAGHGKGCLVPQGLAVSSNLLAALQQRLPGLDNAAVAVAMGSTTEAVFTIWTRPGLPVRTVAGKGAPS